MLAATLTRTLMPYVSRFGRLPDTRDLTEYDALIVGDVLRRVDSSLELAEHFTVVPSRENSAAVGRFYEAEVCRRLIAAGKPCELMPPGSKFDVLFGQSLRIEVKSAFQRVGSTYHFQFRRRPYDVAALCLADNGTRAVIAVYYVPFRLIGNPRTLILNQKRIVEFAPYLENTDIFGGRALDSGSSAALSLVA